MAAQAGFAPTPFRLTDGRTTVIPLSRVKIGHRGRTCTCGHLVPGQACCSYTTRCCPGSFGKGSRGLGSLWRRGMTAPWNCRRAGEWRPRWDLHPQSSRRQRVAFLLSYKGWWEALVTLQFVTSDLISRRSIYSRVTGSLPEIKSKSKIKSFQKW